MAAWVVVHLLLGAVGAWLARRYALARRLLDLPGERRAHRVPTPRSGGVGIVGSVVAACGWLLWTGAAPAPWLWAILLGTVAIAAIGLADDHRPLSPWARLAVHGLASAGLAAAAWSTWHQPGLAPGVFLLAVVLTNVWNFMDGIDGIAATQAVIVALAVAVAVAPVSPLAAVAVALAAACAGFLPFNFPGARLFLGDVGSGVLGFAIAALLGWAVASGGREDWLAWLLPPSAFLIDASLTLAGRVVRGEAWWQPHALHAYQRWAARIGNHVPVTLAYAAWTTLACVLAVALQGRGAVVMMAACLAWYAAGAGLWLVLQAKGATTVMEKRE